MYNFLRRWTLSILKTPAEPHPPMGDPASLRIFNAGRNYFRLRIFGWGIVQFLALIGIIFWTAFLIQVEQTARAQGAERASQPAAATTTGESKRPKRWQARLKENLRAASTETVIGPDGKITKRPRRYSGWNSFKQTFVEVALLLPVGAFAILWAIKLFSILLYLFQLPITYAIRRLDFEMRWYMVTDRSLRLRHGVWQVSEATMSFANIQHVVVSQGPLQRLLGLADVKVKSAGGGGSTGPYGQTSSSENMHTGLFHSVTNAHEIRDLILDRLRKFRETGLGDPDEKHRSSPPSPALATPFQISTAALAAARELSTEARQLRAALAK